MIEVMIYIVLTTVFVTYAFSLFVAVHKQVYKAHKEFDSCISVPIAFDVLKRDVRNHAADEITDGHKLQMITQDKKIIWLAEDNKLFRVQKKRGKRSVRSCIVDNVQKFFCTFDGVLIAIDIEHNNKCKTVCIALRNGTA